MNTKPTSSFVTRGRRRFVLLLGTTILLGPALGADASTASAVPQTPLPPLAHFRVLWMHDPTEKAVVSWTTPAEGKSHSIHYDTEARQGRLANYAHKVGGALGADHGTGARDGKRH